MSDQLDHKALLATFTPETRAALTLTEDRAGLLHLAGHLSVIAALAAWVGLALPFWPVALLPLGIALSFLFTLEHECTHQTPFRTSWLNETVGHGAGFLIGIPFHWFRAFHMAHHRHTNDPDHDPELASKKPETRVQLLGYLLGLAYWRDKALTLFRLAFGDLNDPFLSPRQHSRVRREARAILAGYAALVLASLLFGQVLFWIWLLPLILGFPFLRVYLLSEHDGCPAVPDMFDNTRTTLTNRLIRALAWNMPYHAEHHAFPQVPFHRLGALHSMAKPHLKQIGHSYAQQVIAKAEALSPTKHPQQ